MRLVAVCLLAASLQSQTRPEALRLMLTGDSIINRRLSVYDEPSYIKLIEQIRSADTAFTNFETLIHDFQYPASAVSGGAWMGSPAWVLKELEWAGFRLLAIANNHSLDYGVDGLRSTLHALSQSDMTYAGAGENLARARAPAYRDTGKGRVALISCASTFSIFSPAGEQRPDHIGRPGLNPLHALTTYFLDRPAFDSMRALAGAGEGDSFRFLNQTFRVGAKPAIETAPREADVTAIAASVKEGRRQADWVVVSIHAHEGMPRNREEPAQFLRTFAHAMIDAGADVFVGHGPHVLRGIEIYQGKPIFYSLANFIFENETMAFQPAESFDGVGLPATAGVADFYDARSRNDTRGFPADELNWRSVAAEVSFSPSRELLGVRLIPITLGFRESRVARGRPRIADETQGRSILEHLAKLSAPFGTEIDVDSSVIRLKRPGNSSGPGVR